MSNGTTNFTYTNRGELATLVDPLTNSTFTYGYDDAGQKTSETVGSTPRTFTYDGLGRLTQDQVGSTSGSNWRKINYGYDANDNVTNKTVTSGVDPTQTNTYSYDRSNRLTSWNANSTVTNYEWDDANNRTKVGSATSTYDARNRLLSDGTSTYAYTARGTLSSETTGSTTINLGFDSFDRLVTDTSDPQGTFGYDSLDRLVSRNGTLFNYDQDFISPTYDGSQKFNRDPYGTPVSFDNGTKRALISDQHGDVVGSFVPGSSVTGITATFDPWGKRTATTGGVTANLGYQGSWVDNSSSEQRTNMFSRWYSPDQGRFTSRDRADVPIRTGQDTNLFAYANANPLRYNDPRGESFSIAIPSLATSLRSLAYVASATATAITAGVSVPVIVGVGLAIGVGYVGYRIYDAVNSGTETQSQTRTETLRDNPAKTESNDCTKTSTCNSGCVGAACNPCKVNCTPKGNGGGKGRGDKPIPIPPVLDLPLLGNDDDQSQGNENHFIQSTERMVNDYFERILGHHPFPDAKEENCDSNLCNGPKAQPDPNDDEGLYTQQHPEDGEECASDGQQSGNGSITRSGSNSFGCTTDERKKRQREGIRSARDLAKEQRLVQTIAEKEGVFRSFDNFRQAKSRLGTIPGLEIHHIVEQSQTKSTRSGFDQSRVNTTDNLIRLPKEVHQRISKYYSSRDEISGMTVRDSLNGRTWNEQYDFGLEIVERALRGEL